MTIRQKNKIGYLIFLDYSMHAIISRGLYFFHPFFTEVYNTDNLGTKKTEILRFLSIKSAAYKRERPMMARVRYVC